MRALAEFIMRGRAPASAVALLGSWFPLISPATVALVTLRRGTSDGSLILLWALLPALASLAIADIGVMMTLVTVAGVLTTFGVALLLRTDNYWPRALMALVALSAFFSLLLAAVVPDPVAGITQALGDIFRGAQQQSPEVNIAVPSELFVIGLIGYVLAVNAVMSVVLARWWQAMLYNPGGFQQEFHQLRLGPVQAIASFTAVLYCWAQGGDYQPWASLFALPLLLVGISLAHFTVKVKNVGRQWLVLFYIALLLISPLMVLLVVLAVMDTWTNFRARIHPTGDE